jgi:hypothetical protein
MNSDSFNLNNKVTDDGIDYGISQTFSLFKYCNCFNYRIIKQRKAATISV